jgi:hypothetical protein
LLWTFQSNS